MNNIVLGTATFGSAVSQAEARRIVKEAYDLGVRHFDTAPTYGGGYAPRVLSILDGRACHASTKFAGQREPFLRLLAKRAIRCEGVSDYFSGLALLRRPARRGPDDWNAERQRQDMADAMVQLGGLLPEYLFAHSPTAMIDDDALKGLAQMAQTQGFELGLCSPHNDHLLTALENPSAHIRCYQIHLDQVMALAKSKVELLERRSVWLHGIYSPGPASPIQSIESREALCADLAGQIESIKFVVGMKSTSGLKRLDSLVAKTSRCS